MLPIDLLRVLWSETWWRWERPLGSPFMLSEIACHYFNFVEATAWLIFAVLVFRRWEIHRRSPMEVPYALSFVLFGISDVIEAWILTSWLLWWKAVNLIVLFLLRRMIMRNYPGSRLF
ncbi:hypothetical protein [Schlesneria sp. DSM 10557]|uniref:hypothetical protein n=1 Tax=Schlesneria sp. DSM 10557 TaxID=3044399 RepID=UPI0035A14C4C